MTTDYYPRLTSAIGDHQVVRRLVNEQAEVALLLAGPALLILIAGAPAVMRILYSAEFVGASSLLRIQVVGDVIKVLSWSLGFVVLASGRGLAFFFTQSVQVGTFAGVAWLLAPRVGVEATGIAFAGMYAIGLPVNYWFAKRVVGFQWQHRVWVHFLLLLCSSLLVCLFASWAEVAASIGGGCLAAAFAAYAVFRLGRLGSNNRDRKRILEKLRDAWRRLPRRGDR